MAAVKFVWCAPADLRNAINGITTCAASAPRMSLRLVKIEWNGRKWELSDQQLSEIVAVAQSSAGFRSPTASWRNTGILRGDAGAINAVLVAGIQSGAWKPVPSRKGAFVQSVNIEWLDLSQLAKQSSRDAIWQSVFNAAGVEAGTARIDWGGGLYRIHPVRLNLIVTEVRQSGGKFDPNTAIVTADDDVVMAIVTTGENLRIWRRV